MDTPPIIKISGLSKSFLIGKQNVAVLKNITLEIESGSFVIIYGPSGCGKSTLLHTILGLEPPTSGKIYFMNKEIFADDLDEDSRSYVRKQYIGMVYQQPNWIRSLSVQENVALPLQLLGITKKVAMQNAFSTLEIVGMSEWASYLPVDLSSGQQQRVALARAIVTDPKVIVADEPTGNLDFESGQNLMRLLQQLNKDMKKTVIMVTHDLEYLAYADQSVSMKDGQILKVSDRTESIVTAGTVKLKKHLEQ